MATQILNGIGEMSKEEIAHIATVRKLSDNRQGLILRYTESLHRGEVEHKELVANGLSVDEAHKVLLKKTSNKLGRLLDERAN